MTERATERRSGRRYFVQGASVHKFVDGKIASEVFPAPSLPVTATVGGQSATVLYAGAVPFQVAGLLQVNLRLPANLTPGNQPVVITVGSTQSQSNLTVAVR